MKRLTIVGLTLAVLLAPIAALAQGLNPEFTRYAALVAKVCTDRMVQPALEGAYAQLDAKVEAIKYGRGRGSNFWGPQPPTAVIAACTQGPGGGDGAAGAAAAE